MCYAAEERPEGYAAVGIGFGTLTPDSFPVLGEFAALVTIARRDRQPFQPLEAARITLDLIDPDGDSETMGWKSFLQEKEEGGGALVQTLLVPVRMGFRKPGLHIVSVSITDGGQPVELPLVVNPPSGS